MATLVDTLTASGGAESAGFLNDIVAQLWPNISVAGAKLTKDIAEPMFAEMLPGPLSSLHFVKVDLGTNPMRFSKIDVHKTENEGIKLDMDLDWDGNCDIELDGKMIPKFGVEHVKLHGRLSVLLAPLTNIIPLIGAAQVAFINPPTLKLDFTDAANIADCGLIDKCVRKVILSIISSMAVVPNRFLVKLDPMNDYFKTYQYPHGFVRLTVEKATNVAPPKEGSSFLSRIVKDVPDCYSRVELSGEEWKTSTKKNSHEPEWNESRDFLLSDHEQVVTVDVQDDDLAGDDDIGICSTSIKNILLAGGHAELPLVHKGEQTEASLTLGAQLLKFVPELDSFSAEEHQGKGRSCGLVTILVAAAKGIKGDRSELKPSVKVSWGEKTFQTPVKVDAPGMDIANPAFDSAFRIPITSDMVASPEGFKLALMNGKEEMGAAEVSFDDVTGAPDMILANDFEVDFGATIRASICVRGVAPAE